MPYTTWKLNGVLLHEQGLNGARLTYANLRPDTLALRHLTARWDADTLFDYGDEVALERVVVDETGVLPDEVTCVFRGKTRGFPRFYGQDAESLDYEFAGPWDELKRRALLQDKKIVVDPSVSTEPITVPQGLLVLAQDDEGASVMLAQALEVCVQAAIDAGVAIALGDIEGFDFYVTWDEVADLTIADAITRLLQFTPDAVVYFDYATTPPTMHFRRRAALDALSLPVAPGAGEWPAYAAMQGLDIRARPDLQVGYVSIAFRRANTHNGDTYVTIEKQTAGTGSETDENAFVRTVQLAGASYSETILEQRCEVLLLPASLGNGTLDATVVTEASDAAAFAALSKFWKRKVPALGAADVVIKGFKNRLRKAAEVTGEDGEPYTPTLDTSLNKELIVGDVTDWMADQGRAAQDQNYECRIAYSIAGVDQSDDSGYGINFFAGVRASNCENRTYSFRESSSYEAAEPTPAGLADAIYEALSPLQHEGRVTIFEQECSLVWRPGKRLDLTGGRPEWATMGGLIQDATASLDEWRTEVSFGWPEALGPADLVDVARANRLKRGAEGGLYRTTAKI